MVYVEADGIPIFWAQDRVLYAVNDAAKSKVPSLAAVPAEITALDILAALNGTAPH